MGCFCTACGVSRMTIHPGMPVALIPLVPAGDEEAKGIRFDSPMVISNEGPKALFVPFTLPIMAIDY